MPKNFNLLAVAIVVAIVGLTATTAAGSYLCGDANADGTTDISDVVYLIAYIFSGGSAPQPLLAADANHDGTVDISDVVYLIAYIFSGGPAPDCQHYMIPSTTTIIPQDSSAAILSYDTAGTVVLGESSVYAQRVAVGDVIIGQSDAQAPNGFLRKVTSKAIQGNVVILETDKATMMEAFELLYVKETHKLRPSDVRSLKLHDGVKNTSTKDDDLFNVELSVVLYDQDGNHETTDDQIRLDGNLAFSAAVFAEIDIEWFQLKKFEAGIESGQEANVDLTAGLQWEFENEKEFDLAEYHMGVIWVGPVALVPTLTVEAHIRGDLTVTFQTSVSFTQDLRYGFGWEPSGWYTISESTKEFVYTPPQFTAEFNFEPGVSLNASILVRSLESNAICWAWTTTWNGSFIPTQSESGLTRSEGRVQ
ncbi:MAG: dockerin type I repeat-containing protein [candidate division Zixibacteria bacterium]|nr:dockerin type I repeat-containing protein [candidate division Zixibacteria bacterium]